MEVVYDSRLFATGRRQRGEPEDKRSAEEDRRAVICNALVEVYTLLSEAPSETFTNYGGSDEVAVDQARYRLMGALLAAQDALGE